VHNHELLLILKEQVYQALCFVKNDEKEEKEE